MMHLSDHNDSKSARKTTIIASATAIFFSNLTVVGDEMDILGLTVKIDEKFLSTTAVIVVTYLLINYIIIEFSRGYHIDIDGQISKYISILRNENAFYSRITIYFVIISIYIDRFVFQMGIPAILGVTALYFLLKQ